MMNPDLVGLSDAGFHVIDREVIRLSGGSVIEHLDGRGSQLVVSEYVRVIG